jgi:cysteine-S-conjugate beta-lyase
MNMTHKTIPAEIRKASGVTDSLIRLSIGLEEAEDLIQDLENTFNQFGELKDTKKSLAATI